MTDMQKIQWRRIAVEAMAIVASILFAFAIDAWWENTKADRKTQEILDAVLLETRSNLTTLQDSIVHHQEIADAIEITQDQGSIGELLFEAILDVEVFAPSTAALDTLVSTGSLGQIGDPRLQISLGAFGGFAKDLNERESRAIEFRDAARLRIASIGDPIWNRVDSDRIRTDVHILNLLTMRHSEEEAAIESAKRFEEHLQKLLRQLEGAQQ